MSLYAQTNGFAEYDGGAHKLLSDTRLAYFDQSRRSIGGVVAPFHGSAGSVEDLGGKSTGPVAGASSPLPRLRDTSPSVVSPRHPEPGRPNTNTAAPGVAAKGD